MNVPAQMVPSNSTTLRHAGPKKTWGEKNQIIQNHNTNIKQEEDVV